MVRTVRGHKDEAVVTYLMSLIIELITLSKMIQFVQGLVSSLNYHTSIYIVIQLNKLSNYIGVLHLDRKVIVVMFINCCQSCP